MPFVAGPPPATQDGELRKVVDILWQKLQELEVETQYLGLDDSHMEPAKPIEGMFAYADGTDWDPGSGIGLYRWSGTAWVKI